MIVKLKNIEKNPYRDPEKYPVDDDRVERHMNRIQETGFWNNLLAREKPNEPGIYELAYGYHRLVALQKLDYEEIDLIVQELSDLDMLRIMIRENEEDMQTRSVKHINESVEKAKTMIEKAINDVNGVWEDLPKWVMELFENKDGFYRSISQNKAGSGTSHPEFSIGRDALSNFLGSEWSDQSIKNALQFINQYMTVREIDENGVVQKYPVELSRKAMEKFDVPKHAEAARNVFKSPEGRIAFPDKKSQEEAVQSLHEELKVQTDDTSNPTPKITGTYVETWLRNKTQDVIKDSDPLTPPTSPVPESNKSFATNGRYFSKSRINFKTFTEDPLDVVRYPQHVAERDYYLLLLDIGERIKLARKYESYLEKPQYFHRLVYDLYDRTSESDLSIEEAWADMEEELHPIDTSEWCNIEEMEENIMERLKAIKISD